MKPNPKFSQGGRPAKVKPIAGFEYESSQDSCPTGIPEITPHSTRGYTSEESRSQPIASSRKPAPSRSDYITGYRSNDIPEATPRSTRESSAQEPRTRRFNPISRSYNPEPSRGGYPSGLGRNEIQEIAPCRSDVQEIKPREKIGFSFGRKKKMYSFSICKTGGSSVRYILGWRSPCTLSFICKYVYILAYQGVAGLLRGLHSGWHHEYQALLVCL